MFICSNLIFNIEFNDGGRNKYFNELHEVDCFIRAFSIVEDLEYIDVWEKYGKYIKEKGIKNTIAKKILIENGYIFNSAKENGKFKRINDLPKNKTLLVRVAHHILAIKNNNIQDTFDYFKNKNKIIYGYYIKNDN